jgi:hypothetical protein
LDREVPAEKEGGACERESEVSRLPPDGCDVKARDGKDVENELHRGKQGTTAWIEISRPIYLFKVPV